MVLAPFFLAFGAFGGGLFVASPCVMGVVVWGVKRCGGARQSVLGVCVWGQLRAAPRRGFSLSAAVAFGVPAAVAVLRRFAEALRGGRRGPAAPHTRPVVSSGRMSILAQRGPFLTP